MGTPKCKFCFSKLSETDTACGVCGILVGKNKKELTKEEKRRKYFCHAIRVVGLLTVISSAPWFMACMFVVAGSIKKGVILSGALAGSLPLVMAIFLWMLGVALRQYKRWAYYGGTVVYSATIFFGIFSLKPAQMLFPLLLLYYLNSKESRGILLRTIPANTHP